MIRSFGSHVRRNLIAYAALFFALGGTSFAAVQALPRNSVGTKQLKNNAVISSKVKNNTLTGADINEARLGKVPSAGRADNATHATSADSATNATNAAALGGKSAGDFLGIGAKAADADKWDGLDSTVLGKSITYAGVEFRPRDSATTFAYVGTGSIYVTAGSDRIMTAPVHLPQGAIVTKLTLRYEDTDAANSIRGYLTRYEPGTSTSDIISVSSTGSAAGLRTAAVTLPTPLVIDNSKYAYVVIGWPDTTGSTLQLAGIQLDYTVATPSVAAASASGAASGSSSSDG